MSIAILTQNIGREADVVVVRQRARQIASLLGFDRHNQTRIATAISEIARNAFDYAGGGKVEYMIDDKVNPQALVIRVIDHGPGIANLPALLEGTARPNGIVSGVLGAKRLMDRFHIDSAMGQGTTVTLSKELPPSALGVAGLDMTHLVSELVKQQPQSPFEEIQQQNQELLQTLQALRQAHDDLEMRVQERTAELAKVNEVLHQEIGEHKQAEEEIRQFNAELEQRVSERTAQLELVNKELETFSYSVSHDLRAPLRNINSFSTILLEDYADKLDAEGRELIQDIRVGTQRMGQLIKDMLDLAHVARAEISFTTVDLSSLAEAIITGLRMDQPERNVEVVIAPGIIVHGDRALLEVALNNLLGNAWKFTEKRPVAQIEFGVVADSNPPIYFIRDNGAGFNMQYAARLFIAFQRLHNTSDFEGTGIGLATVQRIIHRHGGRIWAEGHIGQGAVFYFTLGTKLT